jgi:acyl dehydratase
MLCDRPATGCVGSVRRHHRHGLLTLSLLPHFTHQLYLVDNVALAVNYDYNKVRLITPVTVGANVRARPAISKVDRLDGAVQATMTVTVEIEGQDKPASTASACLSARVSGSWPRRGFVRRS